MVIATTFLSVIGMSAGLLLGSARERSTAERRGNAQPVVDQTGPAPGPVPDTGRSAGPECRRETQDAAGGIGVTLPVTRVLHIRTKTSEVYICADPAGNLYYHANTGGDSWQEGRTALFLSGVTEGGDGYHATATDGTKFTVSRERLVIDHPDGSVETQPARR